MTKQYKEIVDRVKKRFGSKEGAIAKIKDMFKIINTRYKQFEESGEVESDFFDTSREKFKAITKTKSNDRIATGNLSKMSYKQLDSLVTQAESFLWSKFSTVEGRQEIKQKKIESLKQGGYDLTEEQFDIFADLMNNPAVKDLLEQKVLDSDQILTNTMDYNNKDKLLNMINIMSSELSDYTSRTNMYKSSAGELKELMNVLMDNTDYKNTDIYRKMKGL